MEDPAEPEEPQEPVEDRGKIILGGSVIDGSKDVGGELWEYVVEDRFTRYEVVVGNWDYLKEQDRLILNNYAASRLQTEDRDLIIEAAGLNRIGSVSCAGNVTIIGSGILLIDNLELAESCALNLKTNTDLYSDGEGSVAVFVKTRDNVYTLINGELPGILDDGYNVPPGITLEVPATSSLVLRSLPRSVLPPKENTEEGLIEIPADINNSSTIRAALRVSVLNILEGGFLTMKNANTVLDIFGSGSHLSRLDICDGATVYLGDDTRIGELNTTVSPVIYFTNNNTIGSITDVGAEDDNSALNPDALQYAPSGTVNLKSICDFRHGNRPTLTITGTIKANLYAATGNLILAPGSSIQRGSVTTDGLTLLDNSKKITLPQSYVPLVMSSDAVKSVQEKLSKSNVHAGTATVEIPVSYFALSWYYDHLYQMLYRAVDEEGNIYAVMDSFKLTVNVTGNSKTGYTASGTLSYGDLSAYPEHTIVEVLMKGPDGCLYTVLMESGNTISDVGRICGIRVFDYRIIDPYQGGGEAATTTSYAYTGVGILGGSGAGNHQGGSSTSIFNGKGFGISYQQDDRKAPGNVSSLFAVFRGADSVLHAIAADYDEETGEFSFALESESNYIVVELDFDSEDFSDEFRKVLYEQFDGVFPAQVLTMTPEEYAEAFGGEYPAAFVEEFYSVLEKVIGEMDS